MRVQAWRWPLIALTAVLGGIVGGLVFQAIGWFMIFIALIAGQLLSGAILAVSGRKPGLAVAAVTLAGVIVGVLGSGALEGLLRALQVAGRDVPATTSIMAGLLGTALSPWCWIGAGIMAASAYTRLR